MSSKTMLILYYSGSGNTEKMANAIADAVSENSIDVQVEEVENFELSTLPEYDGIAVGSPTYFSNVAWQVKKIIDESIRFYSGKQLGDKIAGIFTSSGTRKDAQDCLKMLDVAFGFHHGMKVIEGIIRVGSESDELIQKKCREYGQKLAEELKKS
ncbi:NAD(P)H-dependent oxidoreductase [bacterium]|nr:NAD(P)H-dependent oxidoreductase [bacterium]